ncbi:MAG: tetratricopeptide repeat protein [Burkholderiales bacterium]|nr:tetratricopeptide repeat protein [Burkholderiales bacterium]
MDTHALIKQASDSHLRGDLAAAEAGYMQLLAADPDNIDARFLNATLHAQQSKWALAADELRQLVVLQPTHIDAWLNLAHVLEALSDIAAAAECYKAVLSHRPHDAQSWYHLGLMAYRTKNFAEAEGAYRQFVALTPSSVEGHFNLGATLHELMRLREAEAQYQRVLVLDASQVEAHRGLGTIAMQERRYADAVAYFQAGLAIAPNDVELLSNLGVMLQKCQRMTEAESAFRQAIAHQPDHINAHFNLALILLLKGEFEEGWREYEWRLRIKQRQLMAFNQPQWEGAPLAGKTILLRAEQGFGDTFQFVRYAPLIRALGGKVVMACQPGLKRLLLRTPGIDMIAERPVSGAPLVAFDTHLPLLSLPRVFNTRSETIPCEFPYIHPEPCLVQRWAARLGGDPRLRVGIVWAGRPTHEDDKNRSCALHHFLDLLALPDIGFYSLQKGEAVRDLQDLEFSERVVDLDPEIDDFADTAAAIANLDVVICVDTAVAHLAGAMNKPVWVILPYAPDFRWLEAGDASPWYASMRLFRQANAGDWESVFTRLKSSLMQLVATRAPMTANLATYDAITISLLRQTRLAVREARWDMVDSTALSAVTHAAMPEANWLLGVAELKQGLFAESLTHLVVAYEAWPEHPEVLRLLGIALQSLGQAEQAEAFYLEALRFGNDDPEVLFNLGLLRHTAGELLHASHYYQAALALKPHSPECLNNYGLTLLSLGERNQAITQFKEAIRLAPTFVESLVNLGNALYLEGQLADAANCFRQALSIQANHAGAHNALGVALKAQGKLLDAVAEFKQALSIDASLLEARNNLGNTCRALGRIDEAVKHYRAALAQNPENAGTWSNLGAALQRQGEVQAALDAFDRAIQITPDFAEARWNRALAWLLLGDYARGWPEYEWGIRAGARPMTQYAYPAWQGDMLPGKTLLVSAEQGFGDAIQFTRFLSRARSRVGKLVVACQPALHALIRACEGVDSVISNNDVPLALIDMQVPLMSLPGLFGVTLADVSEPAPYMVADASCIARIKPAITQSADSFKVGLVWAGAAAHQDDLDRSLDVKLLAAALAGMPRTVFYSLQLGRDTGEYVNAGLPMNDLSPLLSDFADTAAAISQLDLVISVDTAVAHLAGAMGVPVWVLLPYAPDWRWGLKMQTTPWYPSARLFRQTLRGDWQLVLKTLAEALRNKVN